MPGGDGTGPRGTFKDCVPDDEGVQRPEGKGPFRKGMRCFRRRGMGYGMRKVAGRETRDIDK